MLFVERGGLFRIADGYRDETRAPCDRGRHEMLAAATFGPPRPADERPDRLWSDEPLAPRRHRPDRVLLQQGDEGLDVGGFPRAHVSAEQRVLSVVERGPSMGLAAWQ